MSPVPEQPIQPRSRRAILAGALGGMGAWALAAVGSRSRVRAADDDPVMVGQAHESTLPTSITNSTNTANVIAGISTFGTGIHGETGDGTGVAGEANEGIAVRGNAGSGIAVMGNTNGNIAVLGVTDASNAAAVVGHASGGSTTGVIGHSGSDDVPPVRLKTGVLGHAAQDSGSRGVVGSSPSGQGVRGESDAGIGVFAVSTSGVALRTNGRLRADKISGVASIPAGSTSVTVTPAVDVTSASFVLLTPKANIGSRALWFTTSASADTFTIRLSLPRSKNTKVAWLLLG